MNNKNRRRFLKGVGATTSAMALSSTVKAAASDRIRIGVIGVGGQGNTHLREFDRIKNVEIAYVCDVDEKRRNEGANKVKAKPVDDLRDILDDRSIDAVSIATPDHWHAPAAILACQAGKHVYLEKPCCHNVREGQMLVAAARKYNRVVQHGTQQRSNEFTANGIQMLREGIIGDVLVAKAWNIQRRSNIGRTSSSDPPAGFDYDMWVGPAPMTPFRSNCHHYHWRWWHSFGNGDFGNDGVHDLDYARWGLGVSGMPNRVSAIGGKYYFDDDQQFPDTQMAIFEWDGNGGFGKKRQLIFEMRLWSTNYPYNADSGAEFYGTKGRMVLSKRGKLFVYGDRDRRIKDAAPQNPIRFNGNHYDNFIDAILENKRPRADIAMGFETAALCNLGNLATRLERSLTWDPVQQTVMDDAEAVQGLGREYREGHWAVPS